MSSFLSEYYNSLMFFTIVGSCWVTNICAHAPDSDSKASELYNGRGLVGSWTFARMLLIAILMYKVAQELKNWSITKIGHICTNVLDSDRKDVRIIYFKGAGAKNSLIDNDIKAS
ncbi:unnamed protein product [Rhizophagus irregularis]|nr:unnamed protein product [Rhizophagus irregularis]